MKLQKIDSMIELCKNHLDNTKTKGTEIESILTKYLLVYICGVFETKIKEIFIQRASQTGDKQIESFVKNIIEQKNSFKIDQIKGLLGQFSDRYKINFSLKIDNTEEGSRFTNLVTNRHSYAHGKDINITFEELVESYYKAEKILDVIIESIEIK